MKEVMNIENIKQLEMLGDPFCLDIMAIMEQKEMTFKELVEKTEASEEMVKEYLERMVELELMVVIEGGEEKTYQMAAQGFEAKDVVLKAESRYRSDFVLGFINHLQNQLLDLYKYIYNREEPNRFLKENGYSDNPVVSKNSVYLTAAEAEEFTAMLMNFIKEKSTPERREGEEYLAYDVFHFFFPAIEDLKALTRKRDREK